MSRYRAYPQNGDCIVTIDSVTSRHPMHTAACLFTLTTVATEMQFHVISLCSETETGFTMKLKPASTYGSRS